MRKKRSEEDFSLSESLQREVIHQIKTGKALFGKGGALAPLLKSILEAALEGELDDHIQESREQEGNRRNGYGSKEIKFSDGTLELSTPRDRNSSFEPEIVRKRQTILADNLEEKILGLYGKGMSLRDISRNIEELYDTQISHNMLSEITDRIIPKVREWQSRSLEAVYTIAWLDAMFYKVKGEDGRVTKRCVYNILGIRPDGYKEVLGCYVSETEGARFWLAVLADLQQRGVKDVLIACIDN